ncbi:alpha/beta hydrolase [candidate division WWE3 bacterium]|uniref:Alpha/beta hydrolase n=1 Tax=candidate division WWE3 bacterium TaxID=2053526 RepID=A0A955LKI7_UNCKA|nr:alpha/beta hydrolase [candidate division WWE3 bacterium]
MTKNIVVLHGWGANRTRFTDIQTKLESLGYNMFVPDLPGFGEEDPPLEVWGVEEYAHWVHTAVAEMGFSSYVLIGHSFGGQIAAQYANKYADEIDKLILIAPALIRKPRSIGMVAMEKVTKVGKGVFALPFLEGLGESVRENLYRLIGSQSYNHSNGIMKEIMKKVIREDVSHNVVSLTRPCLVLWGTKDGDTSLREAQQLLSQNKNVEVMPFEGADHNFYREDKYDIVKYIDDFVKKE